MAMEPFLINPIRRKRIKLKKRTRRNPWGELMIVGANPKTKGTSMAYHKRRRRRHSSNPKRRRHHAKYMMVGKRYSHNPRRRHYGRKHYRRNPMSAAMGADVKHLLPLVLSVSAGVLSVDALPLVLSRFIPAMGSGLFSYVAKAGAIVGGGMIAKKVGGKEAQVAFIGGGVSKILLDMVGNFIVSTLASIGAPVAPTPGTSGYGMIENQMGAYEESSIGALSAEDSIY